MIAGISPSSRGSVISPVSAAATAVSGETRYTPASAVPLRPRKLRLKVRRDTPALLGLKPMPMQGPQAHSSTRAPLASMSVSAPQSASIDSTWRLPGEIDRLTEGFTVRPFSSAATFSISIRLELVQEPMHTWSTFVPFNSPAFFTLSGLWGQATSGSSAERSISMIRSYSASGSLASAVQASSRPSAFRKARVISSEGNMLVVAPSSVPMFVMVARSGTDRVFTPSPPHSMIAPTPPFTLSMRRISRLTSLAVTKGRSLPVRFTLNIFGMVM